jgi:uncharacterized alkaline shock family protein YloU
MPEPTDVPEIMITTSDREAGTVDAGSEVESELRGPVDDQTLVSLIGVTVLAVDGVTRLEPTVKSLFRARIPGPATDPDRPDGIAVTSYGVITDATIDVATTARHQSRAVAESIQHVVREVLEAHGREAGQIRVNVLSIDQGPSAAG